MAGNGRCGVFILLLLGLCLGFLCDERFVLVKGLRVH